MYKTTRVNRKLQTVSQYSWTSFFLDVQSIVTETLLKITETWQRPWQSTSTESYLVVGVGWSGSLNLDENTTDTVSTNKKGAVRLWHCGRTESGRFITCTHTGCARWRTAQSARASWRRSSSAASKTENQLFRSTRVHGSDNVCESWSLPPWWACWWVRGRTPEPRRRSNRRIASETHRTGWKGYVSLQAAPATPPPGCPEARIHCASTPPATASLVRTLANEFMCRILFRLK